MRDGPTGRREIPRRGTSKLQSPIEPRRHPAVLTYRAHRPDGHLSRLSMVARVLAGLVARLTRRPQLASPTGRPDPLSPGSDGRRAGETLRLPGDSSHLR